MPNMVESEKSISMDCDFRLLQTTLHDGGDFSVFDDLVLKGQFDQTEWSEENENDRDVSEYVKNVQENMTKIDSIHQAIRQGDIRRVKNLINLKKLIAAPDRQFGRNSLILALSCGKIEIARYLIESYPKCINQKDKDGRTSMHFAAALDNSELLALLFRNGGDETILDSLGHPAQYYKEHPNDLSNGSAPNQA